MNKMKRLRLVTSAATLALILTFTPGCTTTQTGKSVPDAVVLQAVAQEAASVGATFWMQAHPENRAEFELARTSLRSLVAAGNGSVADLQQALSDLPIKQLSGSSGQVIVSGAVVLIDAAGKELAKLDSAGVWSFYVQPVAQGLLAGLDQALGSGPPR